MRQYSKLEIAVMFNSCVRLEEVMRICQVFNYLKWIGVDVPGYFYLMASIKIRKIGS